MHNFAEENFSGLSKFEAIWQLTAIIQLVSFLTIYKMMNLDDLEFQLKVNDGIHENIKAMLILSTSSETR